MNKHWLFGLVLAAAAILLLVRTGSVPLTDPDEARYSRTSLEMVRSGDLVVPTFEGKPRVVKPPLLHWIHGPLFRMLGTSELVVRLPSALATLLTIFLTGWIARRWLGEEGGIWAALIMTTSILVIGIGRLAILDPLLSVAILAVLALDIVEPKRIGAYRSVLAGSFLGLAFLAKGPVGVIVPVIIMAAGRLVSGKKVLPSASGFLNGLAGWCVVSLPWGLAFLSRMGGSGTGSLLKEEILKRFFSGTAHVEPAWFYVAIMLVGFIPWAAPLGVALFRVARQGRRSGDKTALYCGAALLAGLLFFSLGKGKLPTYILPLAPLVALLAAWELSRQLAAPREGKLGSRLLAGTMAAWAIILLVVSFQDLPAAAATAARYGALVFGIGALFCVGGAVLHRPRIAFGSAAASSGLFLLLLMTIFLPSQGLRRSAFSLVQDVPALSADRPVWVVDTYIPSLTWYLDEVPEKMLSRQVPGRMNGADNPLIVMEKRHYSHLGPDLTRQLREVGSAGKYQVLERIPEAPNR